MGRFPFPHDQRAPECCYPNAADADDARRAFSRWREEIVTAEGASGFLRARRPDTPDGERNSTVSEGIAYGMLIAVMFDDQPLFDNFFQYAQRWFNENGLMSWYIAPDGSRALGKGAATDSDEDMAWALVMAHRQWGGRGGLDDDYLGHAKRLIERIWEFEVDHGKWPDMLLPGDEWRGQNVFNPSYFAPHQYRLFGEVSGDLHGFQRVIDRGYAIVENSLNERNGNRENGLVPAWCDADGTPVEAFPGAMMNYQYDSARMPFRLGQDYVYHREPRARAYLQRVSAFFAQVGADRNRRWVHAPRRAGAGSTRSAPQPGLGGVRGLRGGRRHARRALSAVRRRRLRPRAKGRFARPQPLLQPFVHGAFALDAERQFRELSGLAATMVASSRACRSSATS
ncbi:MAG: glycosyl hydrolase family 8 [Polyangiaceae bacterium]